MTKYLYLDGVDDNIVTPSLTWTKIEFDLQFGSIINDWEKLIAFTGGYLQRQGGTGGMDRWNPGSAVVKKDGVTKDWNTQVMIPNEKSIFSFDMGATTNTGQIYIFRNTNTADYLEGKIYSIKIWNGTTLVAFYDMSTGTVYDQSGNGNHATLTGGTWIDTPYDYLSMDGVDDVVYLNKTNSLSDEIIIDCEVGSGRGAFDKYLGTDATGYFQRNGTNQDQFTGWTNVYVDDVPVTNNTDAVPLNKRIKIRITSSTAVANSYYRFFANNNTGSGAMPGKLYRATIKKAGVTLADYDFTTGTVQDQSGNGNHATLSGGTWTKTNTIISDTFTRTADTAKLGNAETGQWWNVLGSAVYGIDASGRAYCAQVASSGHGVAYIDAAIADGSISATIAQTTTSDWPKVAFRIVDGENFHFVEHDYASNQLLLRKYVGGSGQTITSKTSAGLKASGDIIKITNNGNTITVFLNGVQVMTATDSTNATSTKWGFNSYNYTGARIDNFIVESLVSSQTYTVSLSDGVTLSDGITQVYIPGSGGQLFTVNLNDTVSLSELLARLASKRVADTIALSDTKTKLTGRNYADSVNLSDGLYKKFMVAVADSINLGDNAQASGQGTQGVNLSDSVIISDAIVKRVINISRYDVVTIGESDGQGTAKKLLDQITATDSITTSKGKAVLLSDSLTVSDAISKVVKRFAADNIALSETTEKAANMSVKLYDVVITSDTVQTYLPNAPELIGRIRLNGSDLNVYLTGSKKPINLKGGIDS